MSAFTSTKQRILNEQDKRGSLEAWCESLIFHISNDNRFERYLTDLKNWQPVSSGIDHRGFTSDADEVNGSKYTAEKKAINLKVLLGFISIHAPVISSTFVKEEACCIEQIFERLRIYYDCRKSGSKIMEMFDFKCGAMESREALWERVYSFMEDSLLSKASGIKHCNVKVENDERLTPTLQNITIMLWLNAIHRELPALVKQKFAITLREETLYSIRTEISDAIPILLQEINEREGTISYSSSGYRKGRPEKQKSRFKSRPKCCLCDAANRPGADTHYFQTCPFMPAQDRKYLRSKIGDIEILSGSESESEEEESHRSDSRLVKIKCPKATNQNESSAKINRVDIISSPCMEVEVSKKDADITLDTGAESNLIRKSEARRLKLEIIPTVHKANMADGVSPMQIDGEVHFNVTRKCPVTNHTHSFQFDGLVVKDLNCAILGGMPFLDRNDIYIRPNANSVYLGDCCNFKYISIKRCASVRAATILRIPRQMCILPGSSISIPVPPDYHNEVISVEPRMIEDHKEGWIKCHITEPQSGEISLINDTDFPVLIKRHEQLCQIRHTVEIPTTKESKMPDVHVHKPAESDRSAEVSIDPSNILNAEEKQLFIETNKKFHQVFSSSLGRYNGKSGSFEHKINMSSSLPPQRKGHMPMYNRTNLEE